MKLNLWRLKINCKKNKFLGKLIINIPSLIKGEIKLDVIFSIDLNGFFKIVVKDILKEK